MMSFTSDGQLDPALIQERDKMYGTDTKQVSPRVPGWYSSCSGVCIDCYDAIMIMIMIAMEVCLLSCWDKACMYVLI